MIENKHILIKCLTKYLVDWKGRLKITKKSKETKEEEFETGEKKREGYHFWRVDVIIRSTHRNPWGYLSCASHRERNRTLNNNNNNNNQSGTKSKEKKEESLHRVFAQDVGGNKCWLLNILSFRSLNLYWVFFLPQGNERELTLQSLEITLHRPLSNMIRDHHRFIYRWRQVNESGNFFFFFFNFFFFCFLAG